MDVDSLRRRRDAARAFTVEAAGVTWQLMVPTDLDMVAAAAHSRNAAENNLRLVLRALTGWSGMTEARLGGDTHGELAFSLEAAELYLADDIGTLDTLLEALRTRWAERRAKLEESRKN
jgi:hypothetical protein